MINLTVLSEPWTVLHWMMWWLVNNNMNIYDWLWAKLDYCTPRAWRVQKWCNNGVRVPDLLRCFEFGASEIECKSSAHRAAMSGRYDCLEKDGERRLWPALACRSRWNAAQMPFCLVCLVVGFQTPEELPDIKVWQRLARPGQSVIN